MIFVSHVLYNCNHIKSQRDVHTVTKPSTHCIPFHWLVEPKVSTVDCIGFQATKVLSLVTRWGDAVLNGDHAVQLVAVDEFTRGDLSLLYVVSNSLLLLAPVQWSNPSIPLAVGTTYGCNLRYPPVASFGCKLQYFDKNYYWTTPSAGHEGWRIS